MLSCLLCCAMRGVLAEHASVGQWQTCTVYNISVSFHRMHAWIMCEPPPALHFVRAPPQEHLTGKQYLGWKRIRETFAELTKKAEAKASSRHERHREPEHVRSRSRGHGDERGHRDERGPREERGHRDERPRGRDERYERGYRDRERSPR